MDKATMLSRIKSLLSTPAPGSASLELMSNASELVQATTTLMALTHGPKSAQLVAFEAQIASARQREGHWQVRSAESRSIAIGALNTLKQEIELGLIGNMRMEVTGEVLGDFLLLAKSLTVPLAHVRVPFATTVVLLGDLFGLAMAIPFAT